MRQKIHNDDGLAVTLYTEGGYYYLQLEDIDSPEFMHTDRFDSRPTDDDIEACIDTFLENMERTLNE